MVELRITSYEPKTKMLPHAHEECSFCVVISGTYQEHIRGRAGEHGRGHMLFYPAGEVHAQEFGNEGPRKLIFVPISSSLDFLKDRGVQLSDAPSTHGSVFEALTQRALAELAHPDSFSELAVEGLLLEMMAHFARSTNATHREEALPRWLRRARELLDCPTDHQLSNEEIATRVNRHPVHLAREFRKHFGQTVGEFQRRRRLATAERLLAQSNMPLIEIAMETGFCDQAHFSRSFQLSYGLSPSKYRAERGGRRVCASTSVAIPNQE